MKVYRDAREKIREPGLQRLRAPPREENAEHATEKCEQDVFREQLHGEARRRGTEGGADGGVAFATGRAGELEIGDVGAGDEEHEADGAEQHPECRARLLGELLLQSYELDLGVGER